MTAVEKISLRNREYRDRVKAENRMKRVIHVATQDEMDEMIETWLETNKAKQLSSSGYAYSQPSPMHITQSMGGGLV